MNPGNSILTAVLLALSQTGIAAPIHSPIRLSVAHVPGKFIFRVENQSPRSLQYSQHVYATPPAPRGDFYLAVYDSNQKEIRPCKITDRSASPAYARVKSGAVALIVEPDVDLFEDYCLDRRLIYRARLLIG